MAPEWSMVSLVCLTLVHLIMLRLLHHARHIMCLFHSMTTHCGSMGKANRQPGNQEKQQNSGKLGPHRDITLILQALTITAENSLFQGQSAKSAPPLLPGMTRHSNC